MRQGYDKIAKNTKRSSDMTRKIWEIDLYMLGALTINSQLEFKQEKGLI